MLHKKRNTRVSFSNSCISFIYRCQLQINYIQMLMQHSVLCREKREFLRLHSPFSEPLDSFQLWFPICTSLSTIYSSISMESNASVSSSNGHPPRNYVGQLLTFVIPRVRCQSTPGDCNTQLMLLSQVIGLSAKTRNFLFGQLALGK